MRVYIANLPQRVDRRASLEIQFRGKDEYELNYVVAIEHNIGAFGLWQTFIGCVKEEAGQNSPYFIFCEDDHIFTEAYSAQFLYEQIEKADKLGADVLSGGVSWLQTPIQVTNNLFWLDRFNGMQFTVVYQRFYQQLIEMSEQGFFALDIKISEMSDNIFVIYPYISKQQEFGYSDVTKSNGKAGHVNELFRRTEKQLFILDKVRKFYKSHSDE